jgi:non-ribosomal peptide synthetase-like protein
MIVTQQVIAAPRIEILHELFEAQADTRPYALAVVFGREETTYFELEARANRLARYLRRKDVEPESVVAMLLPRSVDAYAALLGILKAGGAYVPIDPEYPSDRIAYILKNSGAKVLVTTRELGDKYAAFNGEIIRLDEDRGRIDSESSARLMREEVGVTPRNLCYIIYTSGSTGRPKGVMIEHRSAWHLVRAERLIYRVRPEDRVYQGASLSFDLSVEEIWMAFAAGATLVAATPDMVRAGPDLSKLLTESHVTVLSCVPTLLSMLAEDMPMVRLLILGGESCPDQLVTRWTQPGRRIINTYGPTETTVIATYSELSPAKRVTIGRAVPGYQVYLLKDGFQQVPQGSVGEICIGGMGVARGYVGLPELTRARFLPNPVTPESQAEARIYRTGDLGRFDSEGNLEFLGRVDAQVKLRGFRVELTEIETVMMQAEGVLSAACAVWEDEPGVQRLVGYVVARDGGQVDEERLLGFLRSRLPGYMVPALIETLPELPHLPTGKLDRASLPKPRVREAAPEVASVAPRTETERRIAEIWGRFFPSQQISLDDDFFLDLGGHSLLVARMVSELRKDERFARVSVADVYEHPKIASLASMVDAGESPVRSVQQTVAPLVLEGRSEVKAEGRHLLASIIQPLGLYFQFAFRGFQWVTPYLVFFLLISTGHALLFSAAWAVVSAVLVFPVFAVVAIGAKWLLLGRIRAGRHRLWGGYYLRWWFVQGLIGALPLDLLLGTPLLPFFYRRLGAKIGRNVHLETDRLAAFDQISIGDGTSIDDDASLLGYRVEEGELIIGPVRIGRECFVGTWSILSEYSEMDDYARLEDLSLLPKGARVPRAETWSGSPAKHSSASEAMPPERPKHGVLRRASTTLLYSWLVLVFPILELIAFVPGILFLVYLNLLAHPLLYLAAAPFVGASFVLLFTTEVVIVKWLLIGRVRPGTYPVHGSFYLRSWIVDQLLSQSLDVAGQLHATLYLAPWYRALGARLGRFVELSTATTTPPDLLELGDESTIADEASVGAPRVEGGWMTVAPVRLGKRAFVGNSGVLPTGGQLGDGSLVGVLSIAPSNSQEAARRDASWLGSPPILLPRRQSSVDFSEQRTFRPTRRLRLARGAFELLRITLPPAGFILVTATVITLALRLWSMVGLVPMLLLLPVVYAASCFAVLGGVVVAKWLVMGRYKPFMHPLWSFFVWRLELVNALYEFLATPLGLEALQGTLLFPWYLRRLGVKIGRSVYLHSTGFLEWDLVEIGDGAAVNEDAVMQTHLFEDRVLKASHLYVGKKCSVGASSVVLYDSKMEDNARLDSLSLLMKGETLPAGTAWAGIPARRVG